MSQELRNRIYEYVIAQKRNRRPTEILLIPPPYPTKSLLSCPGRLLSWSKLRRQTLGLSQTCRQLRREFLPLHQRIAPISISQTDVERYVTDFFPKDSQANGTLEIRLSRPRKVSLLQLFKLIVRSPKFIVHLYSLCDWYDSTNAIVRLLLDSASMTKWATFVGEHVSHLSVSTGPHSKLVITVKRSAMKTWMPWTGGPQTHEVAYFGPSIWMKDNGMELTGLAAHAFRIRVDRGEKARNVEDVVELPEKLRHTLGPC